MLPGTIAYVTADVLAACFEMLYALHLLCAFENRDV